MFNVLVKWKCQLISWARLLSLKLLPDVRIKLRANEIAFKFHGEGQIMAGIVKVFLVLFLVLECNNLTCSPLRRELFESVCHFLF